MALSVCYDGTDWGGFQRQKEAATVQNALEEVLRDVLRHPVCLAAAGRTDAGVHALGQVVSFHTSALLPVNRLPAVMNRLLPATIRVRSAREMGRDFHARWSARSRRYWYVMEASRRPDPLRGRFRWQLPVGGLDVNAMQDAARTLVGTRDFSAFCHGGGEERPVRTVYRVGVRRAGTCTVVDIEADAFLRRMVRLIAANLAAVGAGRRPVAWMGDLLGSRDRHRAGPGAPASGLWLVHVYYGVRPFGQRPTDGETDR